MLEGKVVIVTGGAQGIGRHAATTFAQHKAKVVIADINEEKARKTATELARLAQTLGIGVDVRDEESVKRMIDQVVGSFWSGRRARQQRRHRAPFRLGYSALAAHQRNAQGFLGSGYSDQPERHI